MKEQILKVLYDSDGFVSGQELCDQLGVSRTAVWKVINQLKDEGYEIESVNRKGYYLSKAPDVLSEADIASQMETKNFGRNVCYYNEVGSTNNQAKLLAEQGAVHGTLVVAEIQNAGKGRRGRGWSSPAGLGAWMSVIMRPEILPVHASMLTLLAGMAVTDAVKSLCIDCQIKWPNDIVIDGKKICGILTEMSTELEYINYVVTGIGINVHNREFPEGICDVATSLDLVLAKGSASANGSASPNQSVSANRFVSLNSTASSNSTAAGNIRRSTLIAQVMQAFEGYYETFVKEKNLRFIQEEYNKRLVNYEKEVYIFEKDNKRGGLCKGIDENGCLIAIIDGQEEHIVSGEVSVRGVLGYV